MAMDAEDQARAIALLHIGSYGDDVSATDPDPSAEALGAQGALGYAWASSSVRASVYRFSGYSVARAAEDRLAADADESAQTWGTVNGSLMLWLSAATDDDAAHPLMEELVGSFAGEE